ncbi:allantoinase [Lentilactobacillus farraginis DSM 18382 = JCM 14108]|uniref:Allantoinase n=1 Tax=Lentilactobacillus farraginis DSM 18382 = JCM 14108 TaxID=1423743 RepID=X0PKA3_9LACO|nr:allantoinase [Lentilactobacillus farraginis DSM 18382 = JCM 14108]
MQYDLVITNGKIVTPTAILNSDLAVKDGKIAAIGNHLTANTDQVIDAKGQLVLPGMVDAHVHINEPGRSDWEDYHTGSQALAAGGTTSMVVMPLNALPARTTAAEFRRQRAIAAGKSYIDFAFMVAWSREIWQKSLSWPMPVRRGIKLLWPLPVPIFREISRTLTITSFFGGCKQFKKPGYDYPYTLKIQS